MNAVPCIFPGSTIVCLASGPSLTREDVEFCQGRAKVIAIKQTILWAPWADVLYACDAKWWRYYGEQVASFDGLRFTLEHTASTWATDLQIGAPAGLSSDPTRLCTGKNSGYQAMNLAFLLGARRIVLLGYDMQDMNGCDHFFGEHPYREGTRPNYPLFKPYFESLVDPLRHAGVEVCNATRRTALTCFPSVSLAEALA